MLESVPPGASDEAAAEIAYRNALWLRSYMDMYILRWACLWLGLLAMAILIQSHELPGILVVVALASAVFGFAGMLRMVAMYRHAAKVVRDRIAAGRRPL